MIKEAINYFTKKGINISNNSYNESNGTNLYSGIDELEEGRVFAFTPNDFDIVDNSTYYYYNVKNKIGYKYLKEKWTKV